MAERLIVAGFGGQGILFAGQLLAYASMEAGGEASWLPSYGPEMRGGTANCMVVLSPTRIGSPYITEADSIITMNKPSLERFESRVREGGTLIINSDMTDRSPQRDDIRWTAVPANTVAEELGTSQATNMVMVGAYLAMAEPLPLEVVKGALSHVVSASRAQLIDLNSKALQKGYDLALAGVRGRSR